MYQPPLIPGERILLYEQGGYSSGRTWKLGHLFLTDKRLIFGQARRTLLDLPLWTVTAMALHRRAFVLATKDCLRLSYRDGISGRTLVAFVVAPHLDAWIAGICGLLSRHGIDLGMQVQEEMAQWESGTLRHRWERETGFGIRPVPGTLDLLNRTMALKGAGGNLADEGFHFLYTGPRPSRGPRGDIKTSLQLHREQKAEEIIRRSEETSAAWDEGLGDLDWWGVGLAQTHGEALAQARRDRAEEKAGLRPGRNSVDQLRRERIKDTLAEFAGAETDSLDRARLDRALGRAPGGQAQAINGDDDLTEAQEHRIREMLAEIEAEEETEGEGTQAKGLDVAAAVRKMLDEIRGKEKAGQTTHD